MLSPSIPPCAADFPPLSQYTYVLVYDADGAEEGSAHDLCLSLCLLGADVAYLRGGFREFRRRFPFLCTTETILSRAARKCLVSYPTQICRDLFLGNRKHAASSTVLSDLDVTHIVNLSVEHPNSFPQDCTYHNVMPLAPADSGCELTIAR